jgi:hypothetical protein
MHSNGRLPPLILVLVESKVMLAGLLARRPGGLGRTAFQASLFVMGSKIASEVKMNLQRFADQQLAQLVLQLR